MRKFVTKLLALLEAGSLPGLIGRGLLLLLVPYVWLLLCGFVFDYLLKWYFLTSFIFYLLVALYLLALALIVRMTVRFVKNKEKGRGSHGTEEV